MKVPFAFFAVVCVQVLGINARAQTDSTYDGRFTIAAEIGANVFAGLGLDEIISVSKAFGRPSYSIEFAESKRIVYADGPSPSVDRINLATWDVTTEQQLVGSIRLPINKVAFGTFGVGVSLMSDVTQYVGRDQGSPQESLRINHSNSSAILMVGIGVIVPLSRSLVLPIEWRVIYNSDSGSDGSFDQFGLSVRTGLGLRF